MSLLQAGQIVRYDSRLWRVDYVNECRARILPLGKVKLETETGGVNVSPNSELETITDVERARDEMELSDAERELAEAREALEAVERAETTAAAKAAAPPPPLAAQRPATSGTSRRTAGGWHVGSVPPPAFREGSLAAEVMALIQQTPGLDTAAVAAKVKHEGNVAACVSRFCQAGFIEKS